MLTHIKMMNVAFHFVVEWPHLLRKPLRNKYSGPIFGGKIIPHFGVGCNVEAIVASWANNSESAKIVKKKDQNIQTQNLKCQKLKWKEAR